MYSPHQGHARWTCQRLISLALFYENVERQISTACGNVVSLLVVRTFSICVTVAHVIHTFTTLLNEDDLCLFVRELGGGVGENKH